MRDLKTGATGSKFEMLTNRRRNLALRVKASLIAETTGIMLNEFIQSRRLSKKSL